MSVGHKVFFLYHYYKVVFIPILKCSHADFAADFQIVIFSIIARHDDYDYAEVNELLHR